MFINKKEKFSIRKFKDGRSDSVKIGTVGLIVGAALAMAGQPHIAEAAMTENSDNTTTISNDKGSVIVDTANIENPDAGRAFSTDPTAEGTNTITKTGKVDYKYVTAEGNTVLEENKNQNSGADKTIETPYDVYGKSGEVFKGTTGGDAEASDLNDAKENGKKETIEKDGKTYHLIGEPKVETTGNGGGVYSDTTLGDVTAKLTPEGLSNAEGKITYDTVKPGGKAWIVEQTGKGTYGKYVQADSGAITSDAKMVEAFKAGEAAAKDFNSANVTADGGIKEGDYVFVLEKNTYVTANTESQALTGSIPLSSSDNVADDVDGTGANLNRTYAMVQKFKAAPDTLTGVENKTLVKGYLAYLQGKGLEDNLLNFKRYVSIGLAGIAEDQVDAKGRPTRDLTADTSGVSNSDTLELENGGFLLRLNAPSLDVEEYSYRDEITPLRAYRLASGTTTITYTYAEEKTREVEKKGSVVVNYQTEDGVELKAPYTDTPETVAEVVTEHYYVDADGQEVVVEDKTVRTPKNVAYNTKKNETEKPQKLTDAQGNVYYLKADATKTAVNDVEKDAPAEEGTVVEGVTKVTYIYEKAGSVIVNYKTVDGTALTGTVVDEDGAGKTVESGAKDIDNGKPGSAYNTADNGMKPTRIKTADGKVYQLESTEGQETGEVVAGETKEVTYVYKEVKGNVVVKYEDTEGNSLADDEQDETDASLDVKYDTADHKKDEITKDGVKYYLTAKELKDGSKPATGDVVEGTTTVTYVYEKAGQVVVNYQTEDGTPLVGVDAAGANVASGAKDTVDGRPGSDYNTADNDMKPTRITTAEGKVYELVPTATKGDETGKVVAGETKEVTYVYKEVTGDVVVHYVDTEGNVIAEDKEDTKGASLNAKYDTTDNKPEKIEKDGTVYYLTEKAVKDDSKPENGDVVEGKTEVTYVYEKAGQVVVHYTDDKGNTIQVDAVDTKDGKPNADYNTADNDMKPNRITTPEGKVYELIPQSTKGDETGKVKAGETTEVTYVYKEITGNVVVHYVDTEGNTLADDTKDVENGSLSEKYDTTDNKPAKLEKDGTVYYLTAKELKDGSKPENGAVVEGTTEITYVYEKAGNVLVHYVDEAGNTLQADAVDTKDGKPGAKYDTSDNDMKPTRITTSEGKVYELVPASTKGNETGDVEAGKTTEVTYVYKEVKGNVVVHYTDEAGNTIAEDVKDTTDGSVSSAYDTTDNKPATITTKDGKVYVLVPTSTKGEESGKVTEGTTEVTYVYKDAKEEASKAIDKALSEKESKIKENPELTNEEKEKAIEEAKKTAEQAKKALEEAKTPEDVKKSTTKAKEEVEKTPVTPEDKPKAKEAIDKALEDKVKKIDENPNLTPEQKEKAKEEAKKGAEEAKKAIDKAPSKEEVEKAKENGKKEVEKDTPTPDKPSTPSENDKDQPTTPSPEEKAKAKESVDKDLEEKIKNIDKDPSLTPEQKEKAKEEAKKEAEAVKKSIEEGKTTEWVDEKGNPIKPVTPGTYPAGSTPNYELVGTVTNKETGKVTHIFKPSTKKPVTVWVDVNGKPVKPLAEGDNPAGSIPGYALVETINVEGTGNVIHVFKRTTNGRPQKEDSTHGGSLTPSQPGSPARPSTNPVRPTDPSQPETPVVPADPSQPANPANPANPAGPATPAMPSAPVNGEAPQAPAAPSEAKGQAELPNTGTADNASLAALGLLGVLSGFGLVARKKKED
ncbi:MucBP domain-containing protein [Streptococcus mitis]|uniref:Muramidase n=1 Tax=Streptococcus mitis TaxID=28037 RepID=A0A1X1JNF6_STRMT|nr:MucBP domain-containing protein [Streptococcus mitis]MDU2760718.1 MucBP domain-containing protein [Streptococcus mitis]ORO88703.1 muramidase [Streptococcus mitis]